MEKIISPDERIKRAEEIYYRRKMQNPNRSYARVNVSENKKDFGMFKKMVLQILICILIYTGFYLIQNREYIFSENVINKLNEILSYDVNLQELYTNVQGYMKSFIDSNNIEQEVVEEPKTQESIEENLESKVDTIGENIIEENNNLEQENIGGQNIEEIQEVKEENLSQMEQDAKYIKENKSLIIPLKGTITSRFGLRNPTTQTVPKNHTGIDIAVNEGTKYIASMSGTVESVSSVGDYRKPCKNCRWGCNDTICSL